jgi:hypothetical protein
MAFGAISGTAKIVASKGFYGYGKARRFLGWSIAPNALDSLESAGAYWM